MGQAGSRVAQLCELLRSHVLSLPGLRDESRNLVVMLVSDPEHTVWFHELESNGLLREVYSGRFSRRRPIVKALQDKVNSTLNGHLERWATEQECVARILFVRDAHRRPGFRLTISCDVSPLESRARRLVRVREHIDRLVAVVDEMNRGAPLDDYAVGISQVITEEIRALTGGDDV